MLLLKPAYAVTITFWHPWSYANRTVQSLARDYYQQTGVVVNTRAVKSSSYDPRARGAPDLIGLSRPSKVTLENMAASGRAYDLRLQMSRGWYNQFWPGMLDTFTARKGLRTHIYGVPLTGQVYVFVYNRPLFRRAGLSGSPRTWSELMAASQRLRRAGIMPYAGGFGTSRPPLAYVYEWSYLGLHNLNATFRGRYPYTAREWVRELGLYQEMWRYGFTNRNWAIMSETSAIKNLLNGRVAMVFVGPSFNSVRRAYRPAFSQWAVFEAPVDTRARFLPRMPGTVVEGLVINPRSRQKNAALRFAMWLTQSRQQIILANATSSIPATRSAGTSSYLRPDVRVFLPAMRNQAIDMRVYESPTVLNVLYGGAREMLRGRGSPSGVAASVQRAKRR